MKCSGRHALSGEAVTVETGAGQGAAIQFVDPVLDPMPYSDAGEFLAPGFIDLQVNGFAGVDFNSPVNTRPEIARAILAILSTGVTPFFPPVIPRPPVQMPAPLRNLSPAPPA